MLRSFKQKRLPPCPPLEGDKGGGIPSLRGTVGNPPGDKDKGWDLSEEDNQLSPAGGGVDFCRENLCLKVAVSLI